MAIEQEFTKNNYCNQVDKFFNLIKSMCKRKDVIIFIDDIDDPKSRTILKHTVTMLNELNHDTIV